MYPTGSPTARDRQVTSLLVFAISSAVIGMFQFGYNTGVINAPQKVLEEFIANIYKSRTGNWITEELRDVIWSITVSVFAVGGMIGGIVGGFVANWCGRKTGLVLNNTVAVLGVTLTSSSQLLQSIECLIMGRFFVGLNCGINTTLVPMYLSEISTVNLRGAIGAASQLAVTIGLLISQVLGLKEFLGTKDGWPFLFGFAFIPAVLQLVMLPFCPESPRYLLISCGRVSEARVALRRLRNNTDVEDEMDEFKAEGLINEPPETKKSAHLLTFKNLIQNSWLRTPLIIGIMMQLSQQLSGINAILYYSTDIFLSAEVPEDFAVYATIGVGAVMAAMTLVSIPFIDKVGRRSLHLYGLAGMFLASIFLTISLLVKFLYDWMKYISVISILFYTLFYAVGPGSIPLLITSELFTQGPRPAAMATAVFFNWATNFAVGLTFPLMKRTLQSYLFLPFTVFLAIFWIFTYRKVPETKNRTFEEIASLFRPLSLTMPPLGFADGGQFAPNCGFGFHMNTDSDPLDHQQHQSVRGSLPNNLQMESSLETGQTTEDSVYKGTRFRFDNARTSVQHQTNNNSRGAWNQNGDLHQYANKRAQQQQCASCNSIPQNIHVSDQKPLIDLKSQQDLNFAQQHLPYNYQQQHGHSSTMKPNETPVIRASMPYCLTTSFMGLQTERARNNSIAKNNHLSRYQDEDDDEDDDADDDANHFQQHLPTHYRYQINANQSIECPESKTRVAPSNSYYNAQNKSKTLHKQSLKDSRIPSTSISNLENLYIASSSNFKQVNLDHRL